MPTFRTTPSRRDALRLALAGGSLTGWLPVLAARDWKLLGSSDGTPIPIDELAQRKVPASKALACCLRKPKRGWPPAGTGPLWTLFACRSNGVLRRWKPFPPCAPRLRGPRA